MENLLGSLWTVTDELYLACAQMKLCRFIRINKAWGTAAPKASKHAEMSRELRFVLCA